MSRDFASSGESEVFIGGIFKIVSEPAFTNTGPVVTPLLVTTSGLDVAVLVKISIATSKAEGRSSSVGLTLEPVGIKYLIFSWLVFIFKLSITLPIDSKSKVIK